MNANPALLEKLAQFRDLKISKNDLVEIEGFENFGNHEISLTRDHVIHLLKAFIKGDVKEEGIIEWVNVVWWSDWFTCNKSDQECIASVMSELDLLEDIPYLRDHLDIDEAQYYIDALKKNEAISFKSYKK